MDDLNKIDRPLNVNETVKETIEIKYKPAKMFHRIMANLLDLLIFALLVVASFLGARAITIRTEAYQNAYNGYRHAQLESKLYYNDKSQSYPTVVEFLDNDKSVSQVQKHKTSLLAIKGFYTYILNDEMLDSESKEVVKSAYTKYFTQDSLVYKGEDGDHPYIQSCLFTDTTCEIEEHDYSNPLVSEDVPHDKDFYLGVYKPFIQDTLLSLFGNYSTEYSENIAKVGRMFVLIDAPICLLVAGILTYVVPSICFVRGHKTLGKALYHIGVIDSRYLNLTWKRYIVRTLINLFGIIFLSLVTLCVPAIISTTMMLFSKKKQGFADYMLNCREIDTSSNRIYKSLEEINLTQINPHHKPVDFKPEKEY